MTVPVAKLPHGIRDLEPKLGEELVAKRRRWRCELIANGPVAYVPAITGLAESCRRPIEHSARMPSPRCPYRQSADSGDAAGSHDERLRWRKDVDVDGDSGFK